MSCRKVQVEMQADIFDSQHPLEESQYLEGLPLVQKQLEHLLRFSSTGWSCLRSGEILHMPLAINNWPTFSVILFDPSVRLSRTTAETSWQTSSSSCRRCGRDSTQYWSIIPLMPWICKEGGRDFWMNVGFQHLTHVAIVRFQVSSQGGRLRSKLGGEGANFLYLMLFKVLCPRHPVLSMTLWRGWK